MHELHLMTQVVKAVETRLQEMGGARLSVVRLKVSTLSHLLTHDHSALQTAFAFAARDTKAEGAKLEIIPVSGEVWCPHCKTAVTVTDPAIPCVTCGGPVLADQIEPEVLVHEMVVEE